MTYLCKIRFATYEIANEWISIEKSKLKRYVRRHKWSMLLISLQL